MSFFITFFQIEILLQSCTLIMEAVYFILLKLMFTLPCSLYRRCYKHKQCSSPSRSIWFLSWSRTFRRACRWSFLVLLSAYKRSKHPRICQIRILYLYWLWASNSNAPGTSPSWASCSGWKEKLEDIWRARRSERRSGRLGCMVMCGVMWGGRRLDRPQPHDWEALCQHRQ